MSKEALKIRLEQSKSNLNSLLTIAQEINKGTSTEDLVERFRSILNDSLGIDRVLLYRYDENRELKLLLNTNCDDIEIDIEQDLLPYRETTYVATTDLYLLLDLDVIIPIIYKDDTVAGYVLIGDSNGLKQGLAASLTHSSFVETLSVITFVGIENLRLFHQALEQESIRKEMELASRMQTMLIPTAASMPHFPNIDIASYYSPHFDVGGDYYDVIPMDNGQFGFCIADVSGKGMSAALLMSNFQANLRALFTADIQLPELVNKLNERIMATAQGEKFITLFVGRYNCATHTLEYINAGHNPPIIYSNSTNELHRLKTGCVGIGMLDEIPIINVGHITITPNTKLVCYTDGLVERANGDSVLYDTQSIEQHLTNTDSIADNLAALTANQTKDPEAQSDIFDDISVLGFEFK